MKSRDGLILEYSNLPTQARPQQFLKEERVSSTLSYTGVDTVPTREKKNTRCGNIECDHLVWKKKRKKRNDLRMQISCMQCAVLITFTLSTTVRAFLQCHPVPLVGSKCKWESES